MTLRIYLFSLYLIFFLAVGLMVLIIVNVNPYQSPFWIIGLFYICVFFTWASLFGIIGFYLKVWASNRETIFTHLKPTLRQSVLISLTITSLLLLQQLHSLTIWVACLIIISIFLIELFFKSKRFRSS